MQKVKTDEYILENMLKKRIDRNYRDFRAATLQSDGESIFELASKIAAVEDAYFYITTQDLAGRSETEYLLRFDNPLMLLAEEWEEYSAVRDKNFNDMLTQVAKKGVSMPPSIVAELREKYGDSISLETAAMMELIELGEKVFNLREIFISCCSNG